MDARNRKVILGLGNILNKDEGLGVHCLEELRGRLIDARDIEVLDGGVLGMNLLPLVEGCSHLLLLDAIEAGKPAGAVIELSGPEIPLDSRIKLSWHQVSFHEVLQFAGARGNLPEHLHLIGAQPADISTGFGLSPAIASAVPEIVERALFVLRDWGIV